MEKPSYSSTKRYLILCSIPAWAVILIITWAACIRESQTAIGFAQIALPMMVALLVSLLGIHRGFGSLDMRSSLPSSRPRDQPDLSEPSP